MARIVHVKKAQQRYATKPVIDPATGRQKETPVMNKRTGEPKVTKRGRAVVMRITEADKTQPLPPYTCGHCRQPIEVGTPYKHVKIKSGPYGGQTLRRHAGCPTWKQSELTTSKLAGIYAAQEGFQEFLDSEFDDPSDVTAALEDAANDIRAVAEEYRESAENMREGFGHDTYQSEELDSKADEIDSWADEVESADVPELPDDADCEDCGGTGEQDCDQCDGTGEEDSEDDDEEPGVCTECDGSGTVDCDDCGGDGTVEFDPEIHSDKLDEWREEVREAVSVIDECPV